MPNHITNKVSAPSHVLRSLINAEGHIDFNTVAPFTGLFPYNGVAADAETCAEAICGEPLHEHPLIGSLQRASRERANVMSLRDESFEQFIQMLRNKRSTGYFHSMDFARDKWGTKWNAYSQSIDLEEGQLSFDTAWACPVPVFEALSLLHPSESITVTYADEDIGSNCGTLTFLNGAVSAQDLAPRWDEMSEADQKKWAAFAIEVTGRTFDEEDE